MHLTALYGITAILFFIAATNTFSAAKNKYYEGSGKFILNLILSLGMLYGSIYWILQTTLAFMERCL